MKQETINKIKELNAKGKNPTEISKELNITYHAAIYYTNEEFRQNAIKRAVNYNRKNKRKRTDEVRKYQRNYQSRRYKNDTEFRRKQIERSIRNKKKHLAKEGIEV